MTIERTRELLKEKVAHLSDDEVLLFITNMGVLCDALLRDTKYILTFAGKEFNTKMET